MKNDSVAREDVLNDVARKSVAIWSPYDSIEAAAVLLHLIEIERTAQSALRNNESISNGN